MDSPTEDWLYGDYRDRQDGFSTLKNCITTLEKYKHNPSVTNPIIKFLNIFTNTGGLTEEGIKWLKEQAQLKNSYAELYLGEAEFIDQDQNFLDKNSVKRKEAMRLYEESAKKGNMSAKFKMGYMHVHGYGCLKDRRKALELILESSDAGCKCATDYLGDNIKWLMGCTVFDLFLENRKLKKTVEEQAQQIEHLKTGVSTSRAD